MAGYDPKRPTPGEPSADEPAPVDALLEPGPVSGSTPVVPTQSTGAPMATEVDLRVNGSSARPPADVPVAAAPEEGTANRAVMIAAIVGSVIAAVILGVALRRRRSR